MVVGVGASPAAVAALVWARNLCEQQDWALEIVTAWPDHGQPHVHEAPGHFCAARNSAVEALSAALAEAGIDVDAPGVTIHIENVDPVGALVEHSRGAQLLVVGAPGLGRSRRAGLAPVGDLCRALAACPVVVIDVRMAA